MTVEWTILAVSLLALLGAFLVARRADRILQDAQSCLDRADVLLRECREHFDDGAGGDPTADALRLL